MVFSPVKAIPEKERERKWPGISGSGDSHYLQ